MGRMGVANNLEKGALIPLLAVVGPTASGKTRAAVALAKELDGEVVSADSMQVYRGMDIGTAKPTMEEREGVPHHLIDIADPCDRFSVAEYVAVAREVILQIYRRGRLPILAGGTGLYVSSLVDHINFTEIRSDPVLRESLERQAKERGNAYLLQRLEEVDPALAQTLHENNVGRIVRALEVYELTGVPMSVHQAKSREGQSPYRLCMLGLNYKNRQLLYDRIDTRVDEMLAAGLMDELKELMRSGCTGTASQAIGYKELAGVLTGECTLLEATETLKRETRRYAKRQLTWFRRDGRIRWFDPSDYMQPEALYEEMIREVKRCGVLAERI